MDLEMDETFEPQIDDLIDEEREILEEQTNQDEEWEPEYKRPRIKKETVEGGMYQLKYIFPLHFPTKMK